MLKNNKKYLAGLSLIFLLWAECTAQQTITLNSPDGVNALQMFPVSKSIEKGTLSFSILRGNALVISPSEIRLSAEEIDFASPFVIINVEETSVKNEWTTEFGERKNIPDNYNQVKIYLESETAKLNIIARAYNEGVTFAYEVPKQSNLKTLHIKEELITYNFSDDFNVWATPKREPGVTTSKSIYNKIPLSRLEHGCERPLLVDCGDLKIALTEARLVNYARMSFEHNQGGEFSIQSKLEGYIENQKQDKVTGNIVGELTDKSKAEMNLPFQSPWRVIMMAESEGTLLEKNYLIQNLNPPSEIEDTSWIQPGKALRETTLTTQGAFAAIDFVSSHNMQYVLFDAGWYGLEMSNNSDATTVTLDPKRSKGPFDLQAVADYAQQKNVKILLYVNRRALEKQLDEILPLFKEWGIAGIKFGFVRVGTQDVTAWLHDAIKKCAQYQMVVDVHDHYRPTGFSRTYPNLLTQEGIMGDEHSTTNQHTLITMFTRMLAGAGDNTICYYNERVGKMGSHASQLAKAVCLFSPLQFLYWYDRAPQAPVKLDGLWGDTKHIGNEPELEFFDAVPTTWDDTKVLKAEIGKIGVIARRKGNDWFVGGINGETARNIEIDFSFLQNETTYIAKIYTDDEHVKTRTRVKINEKELNSKSSMVLDVKPNNGFAIHIRPIMEIVDNNESYKP